MKAQLVVLSAASIANLILGLSVWLKGPAQRVNRYFGVVSIALAAWTLSNGLVTAYASTPWGVVWARATYASASLIPASFYLFGSVFPTRQALPTVGPRVFWLIAGFTSFCASLTPLMVQSTDSLNGQLQIV